MRLLPFLAFVISVSGWVGMTSAEAVARSEDVTYRELFDSGGTSDPDLRGTWRASGYGYLIVVEEREYRILNETSAGVWASTGFDGFDLFVRMDDVGRAHFTPHPEIPPFVTERLEEAPEARTTWSQTEIFELFVASMSEYYPFFEVREFEWDAKVRMGRESVADGMSDEELFLIFQDMLTGLDDGHVSLSADLDGARRTFQPASSPTMDWLSSRYRDLSKSSEDGSTPIEYETEGAFVGAWLRGARAEIRSELLAEESYVSARTINWGRLGEDIGYIHVPGMGGFGSGGMENELRSLHLGMSDLLDEMADTQAIIIDVTFNGGGTDLYAVAIASHFAAQRTMGFSKGPGSDPEIRHEVYVDPKEALADEGVVYTKPVYVVHSDLTASAAEIFLLCMRALPNVTTAGIKTEGALSDILDKSLPNGIGFGLSNEVYEDHEGICLEGLGVSPEIELDVIRNHTEAIRELAEIARRRADGEG